jgi:hypothetical protein
VAGVLVTLAALCSAHDIDLHACGEPELAQVRPRIDAIRARHAGEPCFVP